MCLWGVLGGKKGGGKGGERGNRTRVTGPNGNKGFGLTFGRSCKLWHGVWQGGLAVVVGGAAGLLLGLMHVEGGM